MQNVFSNPEFKAKLSYNGFDLSMLRKFTATTGQLLPVYHAVLSPGDKVTLSTELKTRTKPLASPAMASVQERIEWFFVPIEQIYNAFSAFYYGVQDLGSDFYTDNNGNLRTLNLSTFPKASLFEILNAISIYPNLNVFGSAFADSFRFLDSIGVPVGQFGKEFAGFLDDGDPNYLTDFPYVNRAVSLLLPAAYQKIYYDYYRLSDRETNEPSAYNLDSFSVNGSLSNQSLARLFTLHYRPFGKDYFQSVQVSPIFSRDNVSSFASGTGYDYGKVDQWLSGTNRVVPVNDIGLEGAPQTTIALENAQYSQTGVNDLYRISTANIRAMFAVDKLLEVTRRAGKHYDMQTLAHFGVEVPKGLTGEVMFLGGSDSRLDIGDVIATAGTETTDLGQLAGKGYSYNQSGKIQFEAKGHGVLMAIYSAVPELDYWQTGADPETTLLERTDFVIPEYDELGMQPLFRFSSDVKNEDVNYLDTILGWSPRYLPFKSKYNVVNSGFAGGLNYWTTAIKPLSGNTLKSFLCPPNLLDSIMLASYNSTMSNPENWTVDDVYGTDPFISQIYFDVKKSSKMSTYGLPNL